MRAVLHVLNVVLCIVSGVLYPYALWTAAWFVPHPIRDERWHGNVLPGFLALISVLNTAAILLSNLLVGAVWMFRGLVMWYVGFHAHQWRCRTFSGC